jgi:ribosomal protein S18 acetylase RimI-like enzyme
MSSTDTTRHALPSDHPSMQDALVQAFSADPLMSWLFPASDGLAEPGALAAFMTAEVGGHQGHGHSYVIDDRAVALWAPPGAVVDQSLVADVMAAHAEPDRLERSAESFLHMFEYHPADPHFYLAMIGANDASRGQGLGSVLLSRVLDTCDAEGLVAHLESSNIRNVSLYERHGFEVRAEIEFAPGVVLRPMTRLPR